MKLVELLLFLMLSTASSMVSSSSNAATSNLARQAAKRTIAARTALDEMSVKGEFKRKDAAWRNWVSKGECFIQTEDRGRALY